MMNRSFCSARDENAAPDPMDGQKIGVDMFSEYLLLPMITRAKQVCLRLVLLSRVIPAVKGFSFLYPVLSPVLSQPLLLPPRTTGRSSHVHVHVYCVMTYMYPTLFQSANS